MHAGAQIAIGVGAGVALLGAGYLVLRSAKPKKALKPPSGPTVGGISLGDIQGGVRTIQQYAPPIISAVRDLFAGGTGGGGGTSSGGFSVVTAGTGAGPVGTGLDFSSGSGTSIDFATLG